MRITALGPGREFDRIRRLLGEAQEPLAEGVLLGPGDDAAVLAPDLVVSSDMVLEGIHFRLDWVTPHEAGGRAVAAAISDLAAMGADLVGILASVALPGGDEWEEPGDRFMAGIRDRTEELGGGLLGGDLTRSPAGLVADVVALGRTRRPLRRSTALPGEELWVTGRLGAAAAAVQLWREGGTPPPELRRRYTHPEPRIGPALWLVRTVGASAGLDLSDGLAGDASHMASASGVRLVLDAARIPVYPHPAVTLELALHGGEDYELLVTLPAGAATRARVEEFEEVFDLSLTRIGRVEPGEGVWIQSDEDSSPRRMDRGGHDHFREDGGPTL
jgi:thiamine-monophosphate kinase